MSHDTDLAGLAGGGLLRRAIDGFGDIVEITDAQGRYVYVNPAFERLTGWTREEALSQRPGSLVRSDVHPPEYFEEIWTTVSSGSVWRGRLVSRRRDGTLLQQDATISPILDDTGRPTHFVAVKRDVTERLELQAQLRQIERLAAGVAHQINNPLTAVIGNVGLVEDALDEGTDRMALSALHDIRDAGRRIRDVVKQLRDFGREEDEEIAPVDVRSLLDASLEMVEHLAGDRARIVRDFEEVPLIPTSRARLAQVFQQLLLNACQAIPAGTPADHRIEVAVTPSRRNGVRISIRDTGEGIPVSIRQQIFSPFFTTRGQTGGVGLGLSIALRLVDQLGGEIAFEHLARGTRVTVHLPGVRPSRSRTSTITHPVHQAAAQGEGQRLKVLIVDDDPLVLRMTHFALKDHDVVGAPSGADALAHLVDAPDFDLILCDLMMPGMNGMELFHTLSERWPALQSRVVFITGGATIPEVSAFLAGTDNIAFHKPFTGRQLQALVTSWQAPAVPTSQR